MQEEVNNDYLVDSLISDGILQNKKLIEAFKKIDRKDFTLLEEKSDIYSNSHLTIGYGQTISEPKIVAHMLEFLDLQPANRVLDIGSGSGYTTALISQTIGRVGYVFGLEKVPALVNFGKENLKKYEIYNAYISKASYDLGVKNKKFDRILVSAAANEMPMELLFQLEENGKIVIPIKKSIYLIEKKEGMFLEKRVMDFEFEPLVMQ